MIKPCFGTCIKTTSSCEDMNKFCRKRHGDFLKVSTGSHIHDVPVSLKSFVFLKKGGGTKLLMFGTEGIH